MKRTIVILAAILATAVLAVESSDARPFSADRACDGSGMQWATSSGGEGWGHQWMRGDGESFRYGWAHRWRPALARRTCGSPDTSRPSRRACSRRTVEHRPRPQRIRSGSTPSRCAPPDPWHGLCRWDALHRNSSGNTPRRHPATERDCSRHGRYRRTLPCDGWAIRESHGRPAHPRAGHAAPGSDRG